MGVRGASRPWIFYNYLQFAAALVLWLALVRFGSPSVVAPAAGLALPFMGSVVISRWAVFVLLAIASWAAIRYKFRMASAFYVSFDITFSTAAFFLVSPLAGTGLAVVMVAVDYGYRSRQRSMAVGDLRAIVLGNAGNRLFRFGCAWLAFSWTGGGIPLSGKELEWMQALAGFAAYFLVNNLLFWPHERLRGADMRRYWKDTFTEDLPLSFFICGLGYLLGLVALRVGSGAFLLLCVFAVAASWLLSTLTKTQAQLKSRVDDLTILSRVSAAANSGLDVMPMVESFTRAMAASLPADGIGVVFYQRYATTIYLVQVEGDKSRSTYLPEEVRFQYDDLPLSEPSERLGKSLFEFLQPLETAPFTIPATVFGLPLLHGGEPFGGIVVYSYREKVPLAEKQWLLETCAQSLVVALENCFLHLQAIQDPLTGLYNRSYFMYRLEEELSYSVRHRAPFALLMLDLDDFKAVNDHLGHAVGDQVIRRIGELLRRTLRREDVPARYGGDEFVILMLNCDMKSAQGKAEKLRTALASKALPKEEACGLAIGCSVGLLHSEQIKGQQDVPNMLRRLDDALYKAKSGGKNRLVVAD